MARARSEVGPSRLPVTEEIAGSNPVGPAIRNQNHLLWVVFVFLPAASDQIRTAKRFGERGAQDKKEFTHFCRAPQEEV